MVKAGVLMDDVAVSVDAVTSPPVNMPLPCTESVRKGEVVPMPTLPVELMKMVDVAWATLESEPTAK